MTPLTLALMIAFGGALALTMGGSDTDDPVEDDPVEDPEVDPVDDPVIEPVPDLGATVTEHEDGRIEIALGEDETGTLLAVVTNIESDSTGVGSINTMRMSLLLVPEGADFPQDFSEIPPDPTTPDGAPFDPLEWFIPELATLVGAEVLSTSILGTTSTNSADYHDGNGPDRDDNSIRTPQIVTDEPLSVLYSHSFDGGLQFGSFDAFPDLGFLEGLTPVRGTDDADELSNDGRSHLYGLGGDDLIRTDGARAAMGGDGNDTIHATATRLVRGEAGDDLIVASEGGTIFGEQGEDLLISTAGTGAAELHGGEGQDMLISLDDTQLVGGYDDDEDQSDTFMIWDQGLGQTVSDSPVQLGWVSDFNDGVDQLTILTRDGIEPSNMTHADGILTLEYANGSVGQIRIGEIDPAVITFADVEDVLSGLPVEAPPAA